jgi:uncharacterized membrane protein YphA (DoxX/SURF4 family)
MKESVYDAQQGPNLFENIVLSTWVYRSARFTISAIFVWSGISKLADPQSLAVIIDAYGLIPDSWVLPVSVLLPLIELIGGVGLFLDLRGSLATISGLLLLFMLILGYGIWIGLDVDCGCFGPDDPEAKAYHALRPALYRDFFMGAAILYLYSWRAFRSERPMAWSELHNSLRRNG